LKKGVTTAASKKDVSALLKRYYTEKSKTLQWSCSETQIEEIVQKKLMSYCNLNTVTKTWTPEFMSGDKTTVPIRIFLSAPLSDNRISKWMQFLLKSTGSYGFVHASIQIGPIRLDWFNTSFVKIRNMTKKVENREEHDKRGVGVDNPLVVFDPLDGKELAKSAANFKKILQIVVAWNESKIYNNSLANCQDFVVEILKALRIKYDVYSNQSALTTYLKHLRDHPEDGARMFVDKQGQEHFFDSHHELDQFHEAHYDSLAPDEKALIKCFHRAYQIEEANTKNIPVDKLENKCPAGPVTLYSKNSKPK